MAGQESTVPIPAKDGTFWPLTYRFCPYKLHLIVPPKDVSRMQQAKSGPIEVLLLGLDTAVEGLLRESAGPPGFRDVHFHSSPLESGTLPRNGGWDAMVLDRRVQSLTDVADAIKRNKLEGLKIVLTEKENLHSDIEFWGSDVYSYLLKPVDRQLFQLVWQNALQRIQRTRKRSGLEKPRQRQKTRVFREQEILKDLFVMHLEIQELDQQRTNFLARTSHELRTPLTALQGYLELLAKGKAGTVNPLQGDLLSRSLESCRRLLRLANSLMDLSALDGSRAQLQLAPGHLWECLSRAIRELNHAADGKGLTLRTECSAEIPSFCFDVDRIQQVFLNLLENAVKFTPAGGAVHIRCAPYFWERRTVREMMYALQNRRGETPPPNYNSVRITVEDTGVGIPPDFLQDIFEEYSRAVTGNGGPTGFGLGLAVARQVVLAHQGKIWAESQLGVGSSFTVLLPILR